MMKSLRVGTRASPLAMAQTQMFCANFQLYHPDIVLEIIPVLTTGDRILDRPLSDVGGKALFVKELEKSLQDGIIDVAVHSLKDMECTLPEGLMIGAVLKREDPRDVFVGPQPFMQMPSGSRIGTCAPRRCAYLAHNRPDLESIPIRGNIHTRLEKVARGEVDGMIMAYAGLIRCGLTHHVQEIFDPSQMLPAAAQGVIAVECRTDNTALRGALQMLIDEPTWACVQAERSFLQAMNGDCHTPLGAYAILDSLKIMHLRVMGVGQNKQLYQYEVSGQQGAVDFAALGQKAALGLQEKMQGQGGALCI